MSTSTPSTSRHPPLPPPTQPAEDSEIPPSETLAKLTTSLSTLEKSLEPVLSHKEGWDGVLSELGTLERAKFEIMVGYAINDLTWMYLKTRGIDPSTHDVSQELERIRTYYAKVNAIENPSQRTSTIDKSAAGRFIKASIPASQRLNSPSTSAAALARRQAEAAVAEQDVGMSTRFRHVQSGGEERVITGVEKGEVEEDLEMDESDDPEVEGVGGEELDEGEEEDQGVSTEETEAFLQSLEDDLARTAETVNIGDIEMSRTASNSSNPKRKRAEDLM